MKKIRIVVCGTGFGRFYLEAVRKLPQLFELKGIVSRGSSESRETARRLQVPLITELKDVNPKDVDAACVVVKSSIVGGKGTELAKQFMAKGIHVIQEQPIHYDDYKECLAASRRGKCLYQLNTFYPELESVKIFLKAAEKLEETADITYVKAESSIQVLFPLLAILNKLLHGLRPAELEVLQGKLKQRFVTINGQIREIPVVISLDNQMDIYRPESNVTMFHRIILGTDRGTLELTDSHGSVLWTPFLHESLKKIDEAADKGKEIEKISIQETIYQEESSRLGDIFNVLWVQSLVNSLTDFYNTIQSGKFITPKSQQMLTLCQVWRKIGELAGPYQPVDIKAKEPISLKRIVREEANLA